MKNSFLIVLSVITLVAPITFADLNGRQKIENPSDLDMYGPEARSLFFSLSAIAKTGGQINKEVKTVELGTRTTYSTMDNTIECSQTESEKFTSFRCATKE